MLNELYISRYDSTTYGSASPVETFSNPSELGIRWALPGGIQRVEITIKASSDRDAYLRYVEHLGDTFAIYDESLHSYIGCQCFEIVPNGRHVTYICAGPWKRANDYFYRGDDFPGAGDTDAIIKDILTDSVSIDSTDQTNMDTSSVAIGGWTPGHNPGMLAGDAIEELALIGDSSDTIMDFYFVAPPFDGTQMQAPLPYLKSRSATADPDWIFSREDLVSGGLTMARHIWDLKRYIRIGFGRLSATHDGGNGHNTLVDTGTPATFITDGVRPGDEAINVTQDEVWIVDAVTSETELSFTSGAGGGWDNNDVYSVQVRNPVWTTAQSTSASDYWNTRHREIHMEMDETQADQYRDQLYASYKAAQQQQAFVISSPTIKDGTGVRHPLWRPIMSDSFYFRADNIFPDDAIFGDSDDRKNAFMATAMDYTFSDNALRITPSTGDSRLDALLAQAEIINGQIISTATVGTNLSQVGGGPGGFFNDPPPGGGSGGGGGGLFGG